MKKENTPTATPLLPPGCRVLIVKLSSIGDVLHATAAVHNLRRLAPDAEITWLASPPGSMLLEGNPDIDRLLVWDRRPCDRAMQKFHLRTCWQELRKARELLSAYTFDIALDLQGLLLTGILTKLSGAPRRIGIHERHEGNPLFMTEMAPDIESPHKVLRYFSALLPLGARLEDFRPGPILKIPAALDGFADQFLARHGIPADAPLMLVAVRTTWRDKNWPPSYFGEALQAVPAPVSIVFTGAKGDLPFIEEARQALGRPSFSIAGETSLMELAALLRRASLLLTGDTGPLYIAEAVGTPTLSLWGPTSPSIYGPLTPGHQFLESPYPCRACCHTHCCENRHGIGTCMKELKPALVKEALQRFFSAPA